MGTVVSLAIREAATAAGTTTEMSDAASRAIAVLHHVDRVFSTWAPDSPVSRLRRGEIELDAAPPEVAWVLELCRRAREASGGWFDPWRLPGGVDPTGLVKGWAAELALAELRRAGAAAAMVNAGGDIAVFGEPEPGRQWRIGIRHPLAGDRLLTVVTLGGHDRAVATSGSYERGLHVLDPNAGAAAQTLLAATVVGPDLAFADALATGLLASGGKALARVAGLRGYSALVVEPDGTVHTTLGFPAVLEQAA
ncbi:MAG: FAD:protein FMN transferase [Thermoleophilia bacterium]